MSFAMEWGLTHFWMLLTSAIHTNLTAVIRGLVVLN